MQQITAAVTVKPNNIAGAGAYEFEFCELVFTPENWNVDQAIRVKRNVQFPTTRDGIISVPFTASSSDPTWNSKSSPLQINPVSKEFIPSATVCNAYVR
eukprot:Awhi_evm2s15143